MGRKLSYLLYAAVICSLCAVSAGQERDFEIPNVGTPPAIDGEIDEVWGIASQQFMTINTGEGPYSDAADCSGHFRALCDSEYMYVLIDINDSQLFQDTALENGWQDDSAEFYFDGNNTKAAQGDIDERAFQYRFNWNEEEPDTYFYEYFHRPESLEGVEAMMVTTDTGYRYEIRFPWSTLMAGGAMPAGQLIGIDCFINDDDDGGDSREHQVAWHATEGAGWNTPSMWGTAFVVAPVKASSPNPANGSMDVVMPLFRWTAGGTAAFHDVYLGTTPELGADQLVGPRQFLTMFYYPAGVEPGVTYYWRVDEIEADGVTIHTGDVWTFTAQALTAYNPDPANGSNTVPTAPDLTWLGGKDAIKHQVYFGDSYEAVEQGTGDADKGEVSDPTFAPGDLEGAAGYFWRVDEIGPTGDVVRGEMWSFSTLLAVDDMESYTDDEGGRIYETWIDGWTNETGSTVGYIQAPFAEQNVVHGGGQSMPFDYNNVNAPFYSEAEQAFSSNQDWTVKDVDTLVLYVQGKTANDAAPLYVALEDSSGNTATSVHPDAEIVKSGKWNEWKIPLSDFAGVNLARVRTMYIGVGDKANPTADGDGRIFVDDIGLAKPAPAAQ